MVTITATLELAFTVFSSTRYSTPHVAERALLLRVDRILLDRIWLLLFLSFSDLMARLTLGCMLTCPSCARFELAAMNSGSYEEGGEERGEESGEESDGPELDDDGNLIDPNSALGIKRKYARVAAREEHKKREEEVRDTRYIGEQQYSIRMT